MTLSLKVIANLMLLHLAKIWKENGRLKKQIDYFNYSWKKKNLNFNSKAKRNRSNIETWIGRISNEKNLTPAKSYYKSFGQVA
jgi:hypothetical protein